MNGTYTEPQQQFEDDDYAEIGEEMASKDLKFEPGWEIERTLIDIMGMPIGRGQFGNVYKAAYRQNEQLRHVAVKSSHNQDANIDSDRFIEEARIMSKFTHDHIIRLVGVCTERKPIFIVMELCELGSMREYLQQHESLFENDSLQLIKFVKQLASALAYLEQQNFVHRDVAARNLLMADTKTIKLGDFGLSRLLDDQSSYYVASQGKMPIKWMAPESINFRRFTTASDVWMFGVCSWEILSCGTKPFQRVKNNDVIGKIENGERLGRPELCPHQLYSVLEQCWKYDPEERPLSQALDVKVQELIVDLQHNESSLASFTPPPPPEPTNKPQLTRRNPTIPPKQPSATLAPKREKLISLVKKRDPPKEPLLLEDEAEQKQKSLEREEKRKSSIFDSLDRDKERQMSDQKWLEQNNVKPKAANTASSSSNGSSLDRSMAAAPPKPPRGSRSGSTSTSSLSSQSETSQMIIAVQDAEKENVENVQKLIRKDEPPKIIYTSVKVEKTAQLDRDNDRVYQANLKVLIQIKELQTQCKAHGTPDQLLKLVASIGQACRQLCEAVDEFSRDGPETISRQLELEKRSVTSELKQVAQQMQMVKKFAETRASGDYRKGLINASVVLAITSKHLLDTVDKSRLVA